MGRERERYQSLGHASNTHSNRVGNLDLQDRGGHLLPPRGSLGRQLDSSNPDRVRTKHAVWAAGIPSGILTTVWIRIEVTQGNNNRDLVLTETAETPSPQ